MKKDTLLRLVRLLVILLGIGILVYPSLSEYLSERNSSRATASYDDTVQQLEPRPRNTTACWPTPAPAKPRLRTITATPLRPKATGTCSTSTAPA